MNYKFTSLAVLVLLMSVHIGAYATVITFNDQSAFLSATGSASATGSLPNVGIVPGGAGGPQTIGTVTFSSVAPSQGLFIGTRGLLFPDWYAPLVGNDIAISGVENLNISLAAPVYSLGFDIAEPNTTMPPFSQSNFPTSDATFTITLLSDATTIGIFTFNPPDDIVSFFGAWADAPFNIVEIRETVGGIDDEYFGQFYTGSSPMAPVPIPSTMLLLGIGIAGLAGTRIGKTKQY